MKKGSIRAVLAAIYVAVMTASLIMGLGIYRGITASNRQGKVFIEKLQAAKNFEYMLNLSLKKTVDNSQEIALNKKLNDILSNGIKLTDDEMEAFIDTWLINNNEVSSVHIINRRKEILSRSKISTYDFSAEQFMEQFQGKILSEIDKREGEAYFGIANNMVADNRSDMLFMARRMNSLSDKRRTGYLFIFFDEQVLLDEIKEYTNSKKMAIALASEDGRYVSICNGTILGECNKAYIKGSMTKEKEQEWKADFHHVELTDHTLDLKILANMGYSSVDDNIINIVIAILLINLVFLSIGTMVIRQAVIRPLEKISTKAKKITEEEDLSIRFDEMEKSYAEAGLIANTLNDMLDKIDLLVKENQEKEKQRRMLELSVVNHQVNPHFLFNTLNSVNVLIAMEDKKTALKLVASLARYYRACLNQEETISTIEQEIKVTKEYINIMQLKSPGLIKANFNIEEALYEKQVPGMILQTLVENCIKYGIRTMDEPITLDISVRTEQEEKRMAITVRDNGKGMEEEVCKKLLSEEKLKGKSGFGLRGTVKRIRLMYNIKAISDILKIDSKVNEYTEVTIYIPL